MLARARTSPSVVDGELGVAQVHDQIEQCVMTVRTKLSRIVMKVRTWMGRWE